MPPRDDELPEGTDHIINGAMETGGGDAERRGGGGGAARASSARPAATAPAARPPRRRNGHDSDEGTGGDGRSGDGGTASAAESPSSCAARSTIFATRPAARSASSPRPARPAPPTCSRSCRRVVADTADSIDERLGNNYGEYARKASDSVSGLADNLRGKDVDELYDNVRSAVRKSPGVAIGIAAVVGFTLVRLVKAGLPDDEDDERRRPRTNSGGTGA